MNRRLSIVMLTCNQWPFTERCLESVEPELGEGVELIVVDNASTDKTPERLAERYRNHPDVRVFPSPVNLGFAAGCNYGALQASGGHVLFLNNDTVVPPGTLPRLLRHLEADPAAALVGPRSNRISGTQQLPSVPYDEQSLDGLAAFSRRLAAERAGHATEVDRLVGFCLLLRREALDRLGGFDPRFGPGNFEDDDYCLRARLAGYRLLQAEDAVVHHFSGKTFEALGLSRNREVLANWERFKEKWGLPADRPLSAFYTPAEIVPPEDPSALRVPLESYLPPPLDLGLGPRPRRLMVAGPESRRFSDAVDAYLARTGPGDPGVLVVRGRPAASTPELLQQCVERVRASGLDPEGCPDIVGVDVVLEGRDALRVVVGAETVLLCGDPESDAWARGAAKLAGVPALPVDHWRAVPARQADENVEVRECQ